MEALMSQRVASRSNPSLSRTQLRRGIPADPTTQTQEMLRELAYVFQLSRRIERSILENKA